MLLFLVLNLIGLFAFSAQFVKCKRITFLYTAELQNWTVNWTDYVMRPQSAVSVGGALEILFVLYCIVLYIVFFRGHLIRLCPMQENHWRLTVPDFLVASCLSCCLTKQHQSSECKMECMHSRRILHYWKLCFSCMFLYELCCTICLPHSVECSSRHLNMTLV